MVALTFFPWTTLLSGSLVSNFFDFLFVDLDELILAGLILLLSFFLTLFLTKKWIKSANAAKLLGKDMNKHDNPLIPRSGGLVVALVIEQVAYLIMNRTPVIRGDPQHFEAFLI